MTATLTRERRPAAAQAPARAPVPPPDTRQPARRAVGRLNLATLAGALAVLGGATSLDPLVEGYAWLLPAAEIVAVIYLVGAGARALAIPGWVTALLQPVAFVISVTGLHLHTGVGGVLPGTAALKEAGELLGTGWDQIMTTVPPAPVTPELSLILSLAVGVVALLVDILISACDTPALVALPLLALYSVPAAIADEMLPWYAFALPAVGYVAVLGVSGGGRVHLGPRATRSVLATGLVIAAVSITGAVVGANAISGVGTEGRLPQHGAKVGISPWALLRGELTDSDPVQLLSVTGVERPSYLRVRALEDWTSDEGFGPSALKSTVDNIGGELPDSPGFTPVDRAAADVSTATVTASNYRDRYLPIYLGTQTVAGLGPGWDYDTELQTVFRGGSVTPAPYRVTMPAAVPTADQLRGEALLSAPELTKTGTLPASVTTLARSIIAQAGATTPFDQVDAVLNYFTDPRNGFRYSLATAEGHTGSALTDFLTTKVGYCEQYAATMAIMLRALHIPARVGIGFTQGARQADGSYLIESNNAHAWVEVPFQDSGWVIFDPTPSVDGQGGLQGFVPSAGGGAGPGGTTTASTAPTSSTGPTTSRSLQGASINQGASLPEEDADGGTKTTVKAGWWARMWVPLLATAGGILLLVLLLSGPRLMRRRRRRRRLAVAAGGGPGAASAAWQEIVDTMRDHGLQVSAMDSARTTANTLAQATRLSTQERAGLKVIVTAAETEWYAPGSGDSAGGSGRDAGGSGDSAPGSGADAGRSAGADFARGARSMVAALVRHRPIGWARRWWPASLRRA